LATVFDAPISDEQFDAVISAVLDEPLSDEQFNELVGVLETDTVTPDQVAAAVDAVIESGVTEEQATALATSEKVLASVDGDQAHAIFDAVDIGNITPEQATQLVSAVQNAPTEVKQAFEAEVNVFAGAVDTYVPIGSTVPVSSRRVLIAISAAMSAVPLPTRKTR
jgi:glycyl-tRNA synthetase beta subunit